ncbi:MAG TPA: cupin-like domain-containing protein, partial [Sphingomicrobium sp.]
MGCHAAVVADPDARLRLRRIEEWHRVFGGEGALSAEASHADSSSSAGIDLSHASGVAEYSSVDRSLFNREIETRHEPAVLRGLVSNWPSVAAARQSAAALVDYLSSRDNRALIRAFVGQPAMRGRYFYSPGVDGFNFSMTETSLSELLKALLDPARNESSIYMGST